MEVCLMVGLRLHELNECCSRPIFKAGQTDPGIKRSSSWLDIASIFARIDANSPLVDRDFRQMKDEANVVMQIDGSWTRSATSWPSKEMSDIMKRTLPERCSRINSQSTRAGYSRIVAFHDQRLYQYQ
jgi:hypothetical protein